MCSGMLEFYSRIYNFAKARKSPHAFRFCMGNLIGNLVICKAGRLCAVRLNRIGYLGGTIA